MYQFRIDEQEKAETFKVLEEMGIKPSQAIRLFFRQVRLTHSIPFPIEHTPNAATQKALEDSEKGVGVNRFDSIDEMFGHLDALTQKEHA